MSDLREFLSWLVAKLKTKFGLQVIETGLLLAMLFMVIAGFTTDSIPGEGGLYNLVIVLTATVFTLATIVIGVGIGHLYDRFRAEHPARKSKEAEEPERLSVEFHQITPGSYPNEQLERFAEEINRYLQE